MTDDKTIRLDADGIHVTGPDGNVVFETRDRYVQSTSAAPIYATVLADLGEQWAADPVPYPDAPHMDLLQHLWCIGGEHAAATFVGGMESVPPDTVMFWEGGKHGHVLSPDDLQGGDHE